VPVTLVKAYDNGEVQPTEESMQHCHCHITLVKVT